jgi:beta-lactamase regulating signal transducer with metallopeptidase domain/biotin carboxyl carrier protein
MSGLIDAILLGAGLSIVSAAIAYVICRYIEQRSGATSTSIWHAARLAAVLPVLFSPIIYLIPEATIVAAGTDAGFDLGTTVVSAVPASTPVSGWSLFLQSLQLDLMVLIAYGGGLGLVALAALRRHAWMSHLMRETRSATGEERSIFERLVRRLDVRPPEFRVTPRSTSPFLTGWVPSIVAPETLFNDPAATRFALAHELTHLRRGDERDRIIGSALISVFWFNLPLRWIEKSLNEAREIACDAESLEALGGAERKPYAAALISMMRSSAQSVSAFGPDDRRHREMRIKSILAGQDRPRASKKMLAMTVAAAFIPVACAQTALTERVAPGERRMVLEFISTDEIHPDHLVELHEGEIVVDRRVECTTEGEAMSCAFEGDAAGEMEFVTVEGDVILPDGGEGGARYQFITTTDLEGASVRREDGNVIVFIGDDQTFDVVIPEGRAQVSQRRLVGEWVSEDGAEARVMVRLGTPDGDGNFGVVIAPTAEVPETPHVEPTPVTAPEPTSEPKSVSAPQVAPRLSVAPAVGRISSSYGPRPAQPAGAPAFHYGTDVAAPSGTAIQAPGAGTITHAEAGLNGVAGWGNTVVIDHGNGWETVYAHMQGFDVEVGDMVRAGQQIGRVGSTGRSTGPHVHVELRHNGERIDPAGYVPGLD